MSPMASARHFGDPSSSPSIWPAAPLRPKAPKEPQALPVTRPPESVSPEALGKLQASPLGPKAPKEPQVLPVTRPPADNPRQQSASPEALSKLQASPRTIKNPLFSPRITSIL